MSMFYRAVVNQKDANYFDFENVRGGNLQWHSSTSTEVTSLVVALELEKKNSITSETSLDPHT